MSRYMVNGVDVADFFKVLYLVGNINGYSNFPIAYTSSLTSNFDKQKLNYYFKDGSGVAALNKYQALSYEYNSGSITLDAANRPVWANHMNVFCMGGTGGGGGGGNASGNRNKGGGAGGAGGSGGYIANSNTTPIPLAANETIEITIGSGGAAGTAGNTGNTGGKGGATIVALKLADIRLTADGGAGGAGGVGGGTSDGPGGGGGAGGWTEIKTYNGATYNGPIKTYKLSGSTGNPGGNGFFSDGNANGGAGVIVPMSATDQNLYPLPTITSTFKSGPGGHGGWSGSGRIGYNATPGNTGFVRIYWLASDNTL